MGSKKVKNVQEVLKEDSVKTLLKQDTSNLLIPTAFDEYLKTKETSRKNLVNAFRKTKKKEAPKNGSSSRGKKPKRQQPFSYNPHQRGGGNNFNRNQNKWNSRDDRDDRPY